LNFIFPVTGIIDKLYKLVSIKSKHRKKEVLMKTKMEAASEKFQEGYNLRSQVCLKCVESVAEILEQM
jgi:hypothetical protein